MSDTYEHIKLTLGDGYQAQGRFWDGSRGAVLYLHGIQSHGLWFEASAAYLASKGYAVFLPDRRGSGQNTASRGHVKHYSRWIDDVVEQARYLQQRTGHDSIHLLGVSWGGKLAAAVGHRHGQLFASLTLVAPGIFPAVDVSASMKMHVAMCGLLKPTHMFPIPLNGPELFTDNATKQDFIRNDERRLREVTAGFLCQSTLLDRHVRTADRRYDFPVKLFLAGNERIIDNASTVKLFRSWRAPIKQLSYHGNASHTLEFETDPVPYFDDLVRWLDDVDGSY